MMTFIAMALAAAAPAPAADSHAGHAGHTGQHPQGHPAGEEHKGCCDHAAKMECCKDMADADKAKPCCAEHAKKAAAQQPK